MRYLLLVCVFAACAAPFEISGGPGRSTHRVDRNKLDEGIRPLVAGEPAALSELDALRTRESRSTAIIYTEYAFLAPCIALPAIDKYEGSALLWTGIGACGVTIVLGIIGVIDAPKLGEYGDVLRTYNARHSDTPWVSADLDVK